MAVPVARPHGTGLRPGRHQGRQRGHACHLLSGAAKSHFVQMGVAAILQVPKEQVRVIWTTGPGSYGRDADDCAADAAVLAKAVGKPVRVQYMRDQGTGWDPKAPASIHTARAALDAAGNVIAYDYLSKGFSRVDVDTDGSQPRDTLAASIRAWRSSRATARLPAIPTASPTSAPRVGNDRAAARSCVAAAERARRDAVVAQHAEAGQRQVAQANEAKALAAAAAEKEAEETALAREAETRAVLDFVQSKVFVAARPLGYEGGLGHEVTLRRAIEQLCRPFNKSFTDRPLIEARLRMTLGTSFRYLGDAKIAADQFQAVLTLFKRHRGPDHFDTLRSMNNLAVSYSDLGRHADALKLWEETLASGKPNSAPTTPTRSGVWPTWPPATKNSAGTLTLSGSTKRRSRS